MGNEALFLTNDNWNVGCTFVAGNQQGCDFNSVDFDRIRNSNLIEFDRFKTLEIGGIRNNRQQKSHFCGVALMNNLNELRSV